MADTAASARTDAAVVPTSTDAERIAAPEAIDAVIPVTVVTTDTTSATTATIHMSDANVVATTTSATADDNTAPTRMSVQFAREQSPQPQALLDLLTVAGDLVPGMIEAAPMARGVLNRLGELSKTAAPALQADDATALLRVARAFAAFVAKFAPQPVGAYRLVHSHTVVAQLEGFHHDLDKLARDANLPITAGAWQPHWAVCRGVLETKLAALSSDARALCGVATADVAMQSEALTLLEFEMRRVTAAYSAAERRALATAFNTLKRFSKGTASTIAAWFLPHHDIDIAFDQRLGHGGFADVYRATFFGMSVVAKVPTTSPDHTFDTDAFIKEANAWFSANKVPNVVRFFGAYHLGRQPYLVSEFAAGGTLLDFVRRSEANRGRTWELLLQAAHGLRALHQLGLLHNDLKCNNILVTADGTAKLTDFGMSAVVVAPGGKKCGAVQWKAPEVLFPELRATAEPPTAVQATGAAAIQTDVEAVAEARALAQAADVYAFGMCICEAVAQQHPWGMRVLDTSVRHKVEQGMLPPRPEGFTTDQWALVRAMCAFQPADRIGMDDVLRRLQTFVENEFNSRVAVRASESELQPSALETELDADAEASGYEPEPEPEPVAPLDSVADAPAGGRESTSVRPELARFESAVSAVSRTPREDVVDSALVNDYRFTNVGGRDVVEYRVVLVMRSGRERVVWKRYSSFRHFYKHLSRHTDSLLAPFIKRLPPFARRTAFWSKLSVAAIEQRQRKLNMYVAEVVSTNGMPFGVRLSAVESVYKPGEKPKFVL